MIYATLVLFIMILRTILKMKTDKAQRELLGTYLRKRGIAQEHEQGKYRAYEITFLVKHGHHPDEYIHTSYNLVQMVIKHPEYFDLLAKSKYMAKIHPSDLHKIVSEHDHLFDKFKGTPAMESFMKDTKLTASMMLQDPKYIPLFKHTLADAPSFVFNSVISKYPELTPLVVDRMEPDSAASLVRSNPDLIPYVKHLFPKVKKNFALGTMRILGSLVTPYFDHYLNDTGWMSGYRSDEIYQLLWDKPEIIDDIRFDVKKRVGDEYFGYLYKREPEKYAKYLTDEEKNG